MRVKIELIYLMLQKDVAIGVSRRTNQHIQCSVEELERSFETLFARTSIASILTSKIPNFLTYLMLFIDISNAFVALKSS